MNRTLATALLVFLAAPFAAAPAERAGRPALDDVLGSAAALDLYKSVAISPDGRRVAWVEAIADARGLFTERSAIQIAELPPQSAGGPLEGPGAPRRATAATGKAPRAAVEREPAWSPDGRRLAFLSDAAAPDPKGMGQLDLYVAETDGSHPRRLTHLSGQVSAPRWSPDGRSLALLVIEGRRSAAGALAAAARDAGVVGETPEEQRLAIVDAASGALRLASPADLFVYEYDWAPDGRSLAAVAAHGSGDDNWFVAELYAIAADGSGARSLWKPGMQIAAPRVSPDGREIAVLGGLMSDFGLNGGDVYLVPAAGGAGRDVTPGLAASPAQLAWTAPGRLLAVETADGGTAIASIEVSENGPARVTTLWRGDETLAAGASAPSLSLARDGRTSAAVRHSFSRPPEVWAGPLGQWQQVTRGNARFAPAWGAARSLHWTSGGLAVQGWLLAPPGSGLDRGRRYPLVVVVHGGPASAHRAGWPTTAGLLASQGFLVLLPNPRGSYGAGEAFTRGNVKDFGYGDLDDILGGLEAAGAAAPWNGRAGIFGWSYGGYMAMWAVTRTDRFAAAVAGAGVANWQSYYGQNRIDQWMIPYFGASVYDDPWIYARSSPITFIRRARTPTLVLQGERDAEVPAPQAYEFWHALKTLGVETQLVIYPDEGHHFAKPENERDRLRRIVEWFDRHLAPAAGEGKPAAGTSR